MNTTALTILCAVCSYLIGGINPAIVLSTLIYKKDIRELGSKNPGFTNFKRVFGGKWAWAVMVLDLGKSALLCTVFGLLFRDVQGGFPLGAAIAGLFAVLGHCFPIWYSFKGGKGFLACFMAIWFVDWRAGLIALAVLLLFFFTTHIMSLASILTMVSAAVSVALLGYENIWTFVCLSLGALVVILRHHANIGRIFNGTEKKIYLGHKKG